MARVAPWLRIIGDTVFLVGVGAFAWFMSGLWFGWSYEPTAERTGVPVTATLLRDV